VIVTHTQDANGQCRIYLGGKSSLECWLEPKADSVGWSFCWEPAVTGQPLDSEQARQSAIHVLAQLSQLLKVRTQDLAAVPFETIAALHSSDPYSRRRVSQGRRRTIEQGYMSTAPQARRPQGDFTSGHRPTQDVTQAERRACRASSSR
jgi:hypothetical protein